ncbi:MAG: prolyl-tRNA synthetase associated domain-containing protein [[Lactobacillus] timonensis]|jgi:Ala-tRNA(Pro) deacylase|uniref:prolyl-tRNA synthetase associated domain-containing protein n=1 Tax=[Lactobacillus] timonensis TaxID=1970790 RepID=UPI00235273EF|nr:prolyl-tRNA synthetase associated domain-containing protein [[Lactobacillus] timonensis]MCI1926088.1 prolyl-tRNA synthetase associated domain-containing protein [[Lactobacillus] timonensis]MCI1957412.1 prolyl-tRNA synthetase associated domain-containing protein [[Lactobacillus] timonensis]MCI1970438.1 prolyl-tRNA synthetase associated domain-containing protein [[Lactobacillus] timonensis]MCI2006606.1 prolyl-tRNA synthetase associated domain-containing protein [[Lactobacillus] timonensis]
MNSEEILSMLDQQQIDYQVVNHPAVYTAEEADKYTADYDFARAKNLFLHDKHHLYLVMMRDDQRLDMKQLHQQLESGRLSFAKEQQLTAILGVTTGAVSPFNLLNDQQHQVKAVVDKDLLAESPLIGCHPNVNTQTVIIKISDLLEMIRQWGNEVIQILL